MLVVVVGVPILLGFDNLLLDIGEYSIGLSLVIGKEQNLGVTILDAGVHSYAVLLKCFSTNIFVRDNDYPLSIVEDKLVVEFLLTLGHHVATEVLEGV